jgi:hypothetical protein
VHFMRYVSELCRYHRLLNFSLNTYNSLVIDTSQMMCNLIQDFPSYLEHRKNTINQLEQRTYRLRAFFLCVCLLKIQRFSKCKLSRKPINGIVLSPAQTICVLPHVYPHIILLLYNQFRVSTSQCADHCL